MPNIKKTKYKECLPQTSHFSALIITHTLYVDKRTRVIELYSNLHGHIVKAIWNEFCL